jgi:hypothetical protein
LIAAAANDAIEVKQIAVKSLLIARDMTSSEGKERHQGEQ